MYAAYETLSPKNENSLVDLDASHESEHVYQGRYSDRGVEDKTEYLSSIHPIVASHPISKRPSLYVNPSLQIGLKARRKRVTLPELLFAHQSRPEFQVRFQWTVNAIALLGIIVSITLCDVGLLAPTEARASSHNQRRSRLKEAILINPAITRTCA